MMKRLLSIILIGACSASLIAGPIEDARKLYKEGNYQSVVDILTPQVKKKPKDGNITYFLGASLYELGNKEEALPYLETAEDRGVADASRMLAMMSLDNYEVEDAQEHMDTWTAQLKKQKKETPESYSDIMSRLIMLRNMLDRVEKIEVVDSLLVDAETFFNAYKLSRTAGRILPPDAVSRLGAGTSLEDLSLAYIPENNSEVLWAAADDNDTFSLYGADILDDGEIDHIHELDSDLGQGGDAKYPFLMPDGMTLYFANNGENTLGGYDIFMTRRTQGDDGTDSYYQPQNVGMPYNSQYDDYMLAIDEASGLGWWATDRNQIPGKVTIYIFIPSTMRVNVDSSDPNRAALARMTSIALTQKDGIDYHSLLQQRLPDDDVAEENTNGTSAANFAIDMGGGKIYRKLSDFHNDRARSTMLEVMSLKASLRKHLAKENDMRRQYANGDSSVSSDILKSEEETADMRSQIVAKQNAAIRLEKQ